MTPYTNKIIGEYQSGFRTDKSTIDHILVFGNNWECNNEVYQPFIDFNKAHNSIKR